MNHSAIERLFQEPPFELSDSDKTPKFCEAMKQAVGYHVKQSALYRKQVERDHFNVNGSFEDLSRIPFLPMEIFKRMPLRSVEEQQIVRILHSSSTTSQQPSQVMLDHVTRQRQTQAMVAVLSHYLGSARQPFIIVDLGPKSSQGPDAATLSARQAALRGFLIAASSSEFVLTHSPSNALVLDQEKLVSQLQEWERTQQTGCLFGFTVLIYQLIIEPFRAAHRSFRLPKMTVLHIGGWKKLKDRQIGKEQFNGQLTELFGLQPGHLLDIYGFTEQMGLIYPDCEVGYKHVPVFAEVLVREPATLGVASDGSEGLLQFLTPLPHSYPGISILTDDLGRITQRGPCRCGRTGTAFQVTGRAIETQVRGCGDVLASELMS